MQKKALVIGMGLSGKSAFRLLKHLGYEVTGFDSKDTLGEYLGGEVFSSEEPILTKSFTLAVLSPGICFSHPLVQHFVKEGVEVIGEAELGFRHFQGKAVAITGTNGKTTVTLLVEHILRQAGRKARALGNVGAPLAEAFLDADPEEIVIAELSSYQLETLKSKAFDAAAILNITPDHLDRYPSMEAYAEAKARMQYCLKEEGSFYVFEEALQQFPSLFKGPFRRVGNKGFMQLHEGAVFKEGTFLFNLPKELLEQGEHDRINALFAWVLCHDLGISSDEFLSGLRTFEKPAHRIQFIAKQKGVSFYDDSKGTNVDAVIRSVKTMKGPVVLIAGGVDKGASYLLWKEAFENKVKAIIVLGEAAKKISQELSLFFNVKMVDSLQEAVQKAKKMAEEGDSVLLSPGCSSFDMFKDYAHRGNEFQKFVREEEG